MTEVHDLAAFVDGARLDQLSAEALDQLKIRVLDTIGVAIGAGLIRGIFTLIHATAVTDRWGATHYGRLNGLLSAPVVIVMALAPWAGTVLSDLTGSYTNAYLILAAIAGAAALAGLASIPTRRGVRPSPE